MLSVGIRTRQYAGPVELERWRPSQGMSPCEPGHQVHRRSPSCGRAEALDGEVTHILSQAVEAPEPLTITDLQGLGKEHWTGDAARHVDTERRAWD